MTAFTVQVEHVVIARDDKRGEDGAIYYLLLRPCEKCRTEPGHHVCPRHPGMEHHYERQAFRQGAFGHRLDATPEEIKEDRANVWGWDGNREAPTLTPSFLAEKHRPYRMHSFLRAGILELCGDSTVALAANPVRCWHDDPAVGYRSPSPQGAMP